MSQEFDPGHGYNDEESALDAELKRHGLTRQDLKDLEGLREKLDEQRAAFDAWVVAPENRGKWQVKVGDFTLEGLSAQKFKLMFNTMVLSGATTKEEFFLSIFSAGAEVLFQQYRHSRIANEAILGLLRSIPPELAGPIRARAAISFAKMRKDIQKREFDRMAAEFTAEQDCREEGLQP